MRCRIGAVPERRVDAKHLVDGDIADGMRRDTPAGVVGLVAEREELVIAHAQHAARVGMTVRHAERGGGPAQPAVGEELHRVDSEVPGHMPPRRQRHGPHAVHQAQGHDVDAGGQPMLFVQVAIDIQQLGCDAGIVRARDAARHLVIEGRGDHAAHTRRTWGRASAAAPGPSPVRARTPVGSPPGARAMSPPPGVGVSLPTPASSSARLLQAMMWAQVRIRTTGRSATTRVQVVPRRPASFGEPRLVVAAAEQPRAGRQAIRVGSHTRGQIGQARRAPDVEQRRQQVADLPDVGVRIHEAGHERAALEVDAPGSPGRGG